jgi:hypothetical protein
MIREVDMALLFRFRLSKECKLIPVHYLFIGFSVLSRLLDSAFPRASTARMFQRIWLTSAATVVTIVRVSRNGQYQCVDTFFHDTPPLVKG